LRLPGIVIPAELLQVGLLACDALAQGFPGGRRKVSCRWSLGKRQGEETNSP
jgi:hypothetical protein